MSEEENGELATHSVLVAICEPNRRVVEHLWMKNYKYFPSILYSDRNFVFHKYFMQTFFIPLSDAVASLLADF